MHGKQNLFKKFRAECNLDDLKVTTVLWFQIQYWEYMLCILGCWFLCSIIFSQVLQILHKYFLNATLLCQLKSSYYN